jgi:hypothetical protein
MTLFSAAAAAALEPPSNHLPSGRYSHRAEVQFDVSTTGSRAPALLLSILKKLIEEDPEVAVCDANGKHINTEAFPSTKTVFDTIFSTSTSNGKLSCKFEIRSNLKSFHSIKISVWDILQKYKIWFKKTPGPIKRIALSTLGFWVNVHPGFASPRSLLEEIKGTVSAQYQTDTDIFKKYDIPKDYSPPNMYLARGRISGHYNAISAAGANATTTPIDTDALLTYADATDAHRSMIMLTMISSFKNPTTPKSPMFIPLALKKSDPTKFGYYIAQQNTFLQEHRNIAIVGVVPEVMDLENSAGQTLWSEVRKLPGVFRCDPCARTSDLGKWNISSALEHNADIKSWLEANLPKFFSLASPDTPTISIFPAPEILSKDRRGTAMSVASGLTDASPLNDYMRSLDSSFALTTPPPLVSRKAWTPQVPIEAVDYSFNLTQFPHLPKDKNFHSDTTRTTTAETQADVSAHNPATATAVSAITEDFVSTAVRTRMTEFEDARQSQNAEFQTRLNNLEDTIASISSTVDSISSKMAGDVLTLLTAPNGILTIQEQKLDAQHETINRLMAMLSNLSSDVKRIGTATEALADKRAPASPPHKRHCTDSTPDAMQEDIPPQLG